MIVPLFFVFLSVLLTGISQVLLKIGSSHKGERKKSVLDPYMNLYTITAYVLFLFVTVFSVIALTGGIQLKTVYAISSLNLVIVVGLSWLVLHEKITTRMVIGVVFIVGGIVMFNI